MNRKEIDYTLRKIAFIIAKNLTNKTEFKHIQIDIVAGEILKTLYKLKKSNNKDIRELFVLGFNKKTINSIRKQRNEFLFYADYVVKKCEDILMKREKLYGELR